MYWIFISAGRNGAPNRQNEVDTRRDRDRERERARGMKDGGKNMSNNLLLLKSYRDTGEKRDYKTVHSLSLSQWMR